MDAQLLACRLKKGGKPSVLHQNKHRSVRSAAAWCDATHAPSTCSHHRAGSLGETPHTSFCFAAAWMKLSGHDLRHTCASLLHRSRKWARVPCPRGARGGWCCIFTYMWGVYLERLYVAVGWCVGGHEESLFYTGANEPCCGEKKKKYKRTRRGSGVCQRRYKHNLAGNHLHSYTQTHTHTPLPAQETPACRHSSSWCHSDALFIVFKHGFSCFHSILHSLCYS